MEPLSLERKFPSPGELVAIKLSGSMVLPRAPTFGLARKYLILDPDDDDVAKIFGDTMAK
jgi:hypothetical protein